MTGYTIRTALLEEVDTIVYHRSAMFIEMGRDLAKVRASEPAVAAWLQTHMAAGTYFGYFAVAQDGSIAAGAGLSLLDIMPGPASITPERGYIYNVYTEHAHRRQGLASRLVQSCLETCRARGIPIVTLHASEAGRPVYEHLGFELSNEMRLILS